MKRRTTKTNHTPGPWSCEGGWVCGPVEYGTGGEACVVAQIHSGPDCALDEHTDANALLVTAAPDLLEAARATLALWDKHGLGDSDTESEPVYHALREAVRKATNH